MVNEKLLMKPAKKVLGEFTWNQMKTLEEMQS